MNSFDYFKYKVDKGIILLAILTQNGNISSIFINILVECWIDAHKKNKIKKYESYIEYDMFDESVYV